MNFFSAKQIALRSVFSRHAVYQDDSGGERIKRSNLTRVLHVLLLVSVLHQLISSEFISRPGPGEAPSALYRLHEYIGMLSLGVVMGFWVWALLRNGETRLGELFPWASPGRTRAIFGDIICQARHLSPAELFERVSGILASSVHGLGLLVVSAMAVTGTAYFFAAGTPVGHDALSLHRLMANLMWVYLIGHSAVALLHHLLGSDVLRRMFWIQRGRTVKAAAGIKPAGSVWLGKLSKDALHERPGPF
jgi:cytochrome b561